MTGNPMLLVIVAAVMFAILGGVTLLSHIYSLNGIKAKTVGHGQHGTARWANKSEIKKIYRHIPFTPEKWRKQAAKGQTPTADGEPLPQGIVVGCTGNTTAMVDIVAKYHPELMVEPTESSDSTTGGQSQQMSERDTPRTTKPPVKDKRSGGGGGLQTTPKSKRTPAPAETATPEVNSDGHS